MRFRGVLVALVVLLGLSAALAAASGYEVSSSGAIDVPERTVEVQQQSHTIDSLIRAEAGDQVTVSVDAPEEVYRLHIRNSDERIEASQRGDGSATFTYDLTGYEPGSYAVSPYADGVYRDVLPLLVSGYDVGVDAPASVAANNQLEVTLAVTRTDDAVAPEPAKVQVVLANEGETRTIEAFPSGSGYVATVDASALDAGTYSLYGIAQGTEEASGRQELLGQSDGRSVTIQEETARTPVTTDDETTRATTPPATSATSDGNSAITPRPRTGTPGAETTGEATPGFTVLGTAVAVLVGLFMLGRR